MASELETKPRYTRNKRRLTESEACPVHGEENVHAKRQRVAWDNVLEIKPHASQLDKENVETKCPIHAGNSLGDSKAVNIIDNEDRGYMTKPLTCSKRENQTFKCPEIKSDTEAETQSSEYNGFQELKCPIHGVNGSASLHIKQEKLEEQDFGQTEQTPEFLPSCRHGETTKKQLSTSKQYAAPTALTKVVDSPAEELCGVAANTRERHVGEGDALQTHDGFFLLNDPGTRGVMSEHGDTGVRDSESCGESSSNTGQSGEDSRDCAESDATPSLFEEINSNISDNLADEVSQKLTPVMPTVDCEDAPDSDHSDDQQNRESIKHVGNARKIYSSSRKSNTSRLNVLALTRCTSKEDLPPDIEKKNQLVGHKRKHLARCIPCGGYFVWYGMSKHLLIRHKAEWNLALRETRREQTQVERKDDLESSHSDETETATHNDAETNEINFNSSTSVSRKVALLALNSCTSKENLPQHIEEKNQRVQDYRRHFARCIPCGRYIAWDGIKKHLILKHKVEWNLAVDEAMKKDDEQTDGMEASVNIEIQLNETAKIDTVARMLVSLAVAKCTSSKDLPSHIMERNQPQHDQKKHSVRCETCGKYVQLVSSKRHMIVHHRDKWELTLKQVAVEVEKSNQPPVLDNAQTDMIAEHKTDREKILEDSSDCAIKQKHNGSLQLRESDDIVEDGLQNVSAEDEVGVEIRAKVDNISTPVAEALQMNLSLQRAIMRKIAALAIDMCTSREDLPHDIAKKNQMEPKPRRHFLHCNTCGRHIARDSVRRHLILQHKDEWNLAWKKASIEQDEVDQVYKKPHYFYCTECNGKQITSLPKKIDHYQKYHPEVTTHHCRHATSMFLQLLDSNQCHNDFEVVQLLQKHNKTNRRQEGNKTQQKFIVCPICTEEVCDVRRHMSKHVGKVIDAKERGVYYCTYCHMTLQNPQDALHHWIHNHKLAKKNRAGRVTDTNQILSASRNQASPVSNVQAMETAQVGKETSDDFQAEFLDEHKQMLDDWEVILKFFKGPNTCQDCGQSFSREDELRNHNANGSCLIGTVIRCDECTEVFVCYSDLKEHVKDKHFQADKEECPICKKRLSQRVMARHLSAVHKQEPVHPCKICRKMFHSFLAMKKHRVEDHGEALNKPKYVCEICGYVSTIRDTFRGHMNNHTGETLKCSYCDAKFTHPYSKYRHEQSTHKGKEKVKCPQCPATFVQRASLNRHLKTHMKIRYACDICGKTYSQTHPIMQHRKQKHPDEKNVPVSQLLVSDDVSSD